jgi:hypothetical protein
VEIGGDILCTGRERDGGDWRVHSVVCQSDDATNIASRPSCDRIRVCTNRDRRRASGVLLGEFHSHPQHNPRHIKPISDHDLYQLTLAAANGVHSCSAVIAYEGVYWCAASGGTLRSLLPDIETYYARNGYGPSEWRRSMSLCRQPVAANVPPDLRCLHWLFCVLRREYAHLMASASKHQQTELVQRFFRLLERYGYSALFLPWENHPSRWTDPTDARTVAQRVAMTASHGSR